MHTCFRQFYAALLCCREFLHNELYTYRVKELLKVSKVQDSIRARDFIGIGCYFPSCAAPFPSMGFRAVPLRP
jgi:hypothetical protein